MIRRGVVPLYKVVRPFYKINQFKFNNNKIINNYCSIMTTSPTQEKLTRELPKWTAPINPEADNSQLKVYNTLTKNKVNL
jgi:hypothetical protein